MESHVDAYFKLGKRLFIYNVQSPKAFQYNDNTYNTYEN